MMKVLAKARSTAAHLATAADVRFVSWAGQLHDLLVGAGNAFSARAVNTLPALTARAQRIMMEVAESSESLAETSDSVLLESISPAAKRTAAVVGVLGRVATELARSTATVLVGRQRSVEADRDARHEETGERVAAMVREGLDPFAVGRSLRGDLRDRRNAERRRRRRAR